MVKRLFSVLAALMLLTGLAPAAQAELAGVGPSIAPHGYPAWYEDTSGLRLELCAPPPAGYATKPNMCIGDPLELDENGEPIHPLVITGESFWWLGETAIALPSGDAELTLAIEGTFGGAEVAIDGQQISFGRTRIRIDTPVPGDYTVTHPYGERTFTVTDVEEGINYTADIGAANFLNPAAGFAGTLSAPIGPFLTWPDYLDEPSLKLFVTDPETGLPTEEVLEQYVGDPNVAHTVVGSPTGNNVFRIEGPEGADLDGQGNNVVETDLFFVMGKVWDETNAPEPYVYETFPQKNLFAVGPINRAAPYPTASDDPSLVLTDPDMNGVAGADFSEAYSLGYPQWYQEALPVLDENGDPVLDETTGEPQLQGGIQLTLCPPGHAMCISDPIDQGNPDHVGLQTGGEGFWWYGGASIEVGNDTYDVEFALEATFGGDESIVEGQQIAFGRERIRFDFDADLPAGTHTYRVTHPYGERILELPADEGRRDRIRFVADIGMADPSDPDYAFVGALYSIIGPTFLTWPEFDNRDPVFLAANPEYQSLQQPSDPTDLASPLAQFVGDPAVEREVVGSPIADADHPSGFRNFVRIERLTSGTPEDGEWELVGETELFTISGKVFDPATFEFPAPTLVAQPDAAILDMALAETDIDVAANDQIDSPAGSITTFSVIDAPNDGTAEFQNDLLGIVTYTPDADLALAGGTDEFTYQITQTNGDVVLTSNIATVTVTVVPVETITIDRARFSTRNLRLDLRGTSNVPGTALSIYAGVETTGTPIGTVVVDDAGRWRFRGTATTNITDVTVLSDSADATTETRALDVR